MSRHCTFSSWASLDTRMGIMTDYFTDEKSKPRGGSQLVPDQPDHLTTVRDGAGVETQLAKAEHSLLEPRGSRCGPRPVHRGQLGLLHLAGSPWSSETSATCFLATHAGASMGPPLSPP